MESNRFGYQKRLTPGEILFSEGDGGNEMYLIKSGQIMITKRIGNEEKTLAILKDGDFFGEMAVLDQSPRSASAIAKTEAELIIVDRDAFLKQVRENPFISYVIETLTKRLRQTDEMLKFMYIKNEEKRFVSFILNKAMSQGKQTPEGLDSGIPSSPDSISGMIGVDRNKIENFLDILTRGNILIQRDTLIIADMKRLEKYREYLDLKETFER